MNINYKKRIYNKLTLETNTNSIYINLNCLIPARVIRGFKYTVTSYHDLQVESSESNIRWRVHKEKHKEQLSSQNRN